MTFFLGHRSTLKQALVMLNTLKRFAKLYLLYATLPHK